MDIRYEFDPDSLFSGCDSTDMAGVDVEAGVQRYADLVLKALGEWYPAASIAVVAGERERVLIDGESRDCYEAEVVEHIAGQVFGDWAWVVEVSQELIT